MALKGDLLTLMDVLDLDESFIDQQLKIIMNRKTLSKRHFVSALTLLQYKLNINLCERSECENDEEFLFIVKLINQAEADNIDYICKIVDIVLNLNKSSVICKSEHLLQQILSNPNLCDSSSFSDTSASNSTFLSLKVCEKILDVLTQNSGKANLLFIDLPLENILTSDNEMLKVHFLTRTVPKLFEAVTGYNILDRIWKHIKAIKLETSHETSILRTLCSLSEFFLPHIDCTDSVKFESEIVSQCEFWNIILWGLMADSSSRKMAIYLTKRAIDYLMYIKENINIKFNKISLFSWKSEDAKLLKNMWDNYFVLIESLEEKQGNIVLPSLQLVENLNLINECWFKCIFNLGLKHDNYQVRVKCIEYMLKRKIHNQEEALMLLQALNDINIYLIENFKFQKDISETLKKNPVILKAIAYIQWSAVPLYQISCVLANLEEYVQLEKTEIIKIITDLLKIPCNNIALRKAILINFTIFFVFNSKQLHWIEYVNVMNCICQSEVNILEMKFTTLNITKNFILKPEEKIDFMNTITESYILTDFVLLYLQYHNEDIQIMVDIITGKIRKIRNIIDRKYSNRRECLIDMIFLAQLMNKTVEQYDDLKLIHNVIANEYKTIWQYIFCLLNSNCILSIEELKLLYIEIISMAEYLNDADIILNIYKTSVSILNDEHNNLHSKNLSMILMIISVKNSVLKKYYKQEVINLEGTLELLNKTAISHRKDIENNGKMRSFFFEKSCELVDYYLLYDQFKESLNDIIIHVEKVIDSGGYGCLQWILKIMNKVLPILIEEKTITYELTKFIDRMWKEIEELKSNTQYTPCVKEFVNLITQDSILQKPEYNNIVLFYCMTFIENGHTKAIPINFLMKEICSKNCISTYNHLILVFSEILLFSPILKKDIRVVERVTYELQNDPKFTPNKNNTDIHFSFEIHYLSVETLSKIKNAVVLKNIATLLRRKIDEIFKNKTRYHENSQAHHTLLTCLQHLLFILLLQSRNNTQMTASWCKEFLGKLPHQQNVRICFEWYIALHSYLEEQEINSEFLQHLQCSNIPLTSQFMIIYWIMKHKMVTNAYTHKEYEFVMDTLLSHAMGQVFNIRLHAQYLTSKLYKSTENNKDKYSYIMEIINKTFAENSHDKNFLRIQEDYFVNNFNFIGNLTPCFIYYALPQYMKNIRDVLDKKYVMDIMENVNKNTYKKNTNDKFSEECNIHRKSDYEVVNLKWHKYVEQNIDSEIVIGTVQKKYIPWKLMSDVDVNNVYRKNKSRSELIVVASMIDKLPNLGGMARTSEVFGVKKYVVDSIRHLQDKQFQGLSVSAERWVDVEEVRPGPPLKKYLMSMKAEGYSVVAAEQTSCSRPLHSFKFPTKTLLLLGHEKEGIPCDLLPLMDYCIEIPQQGVIRSLNVHVTAAIFIWEYTRQNTL